jgi:hypothetical protein
MEKSAFKQISGLINAAVIAHHSLLMEASGGSLSYEKIKEITDGLLKQFAGSFPNISEDDRQRLLKGVSDSYSSTVGEKMIAVTNKDAPRWFDAKKHEISWDHWQAYKNMLIGQGRSQTIIDYNEKVIDTVLDYSGDPRDSGSWARKGLVMGNVQSGKTQNYLGLINKAIDAGYQTIIVLGGHLNDLRMQTQERIDEGVLGAPSRHLIETSAGQLGPIGVGLWHKNKIIPATTTAGDFSGPFADKFGVKLDVGTTVIFTIKKHTGVMAALVDWITSQHYLDPSEGKVLSKPMLLIDDEADYASINTKSQKEEVTLTNQLIRQILSLFSKSTYVAYTATPFANVFIDPDENSYSEHDDLFPSDFMIKMPVPTNYMGQEFFFGDTVLRNELNATSPLIEIHDHLPIYELKTKDDAPYELPESLKDAVRAFVIITAVRAMRGEQNSHNTMLVNVSHLSKHQNALEDLITRYKKKLFEALSIYGSLGIEHARRNKLLAELEKTYNSKFLIQENYDSILKRLASHERREIAVWAINQSGKTKNRHVLNYATYDEFGLNVIVIGGHKLSRGLTLEGLSISYFARNSKAYDTLMQMCRWFGYRRPYKDLCKVYLPEESISWYAFISSTISELYSELELMAERQERPKDFGLKVREHPGAMLITAKNKIGWGRSQTISQDLWGQTQRRFEFYDDPLRNSTNVDYTKIFLEGLLAQQGAEITPDKKSGSILISNVSYKNLIDYVKAIDLPEDDVGNSALINQLIAMDEAGISKPKVLLFNQNTSASPQWFKDLSSADRDFLDTPYTVAGQKIILPRRTMSLDKGRFRVRSVHLGNSDDERLFLSPEHQKDIREDKSPKKPVDHDYIASEHRDFAGLKIYFFGISQRRESDDSNPPNLIHGHEATLGYTLSFPRPEKLRGEKTAKEIRALVKTTRHSYYLNKIHAKNKDLGAYEDIEHE